jgi:hypothetical protein
MKKLAQDKGFSELRGTNTDPSAVPLRGFESVRFVCPTCHTVDRFGTMTLAGIAFGRCNADGCDFRWRRTMDWLVFVDARTGRCFSGRLELDAQMVRRGR